MDAATILSGLVRVGIVTDLDKKERKVRVLFKDTEYTSGWLFVLQHNEACVAVAPDGSHTHSVHDTYTGGGSASDQPSHNHPKTCVTYWMPRVNDEVLAIYLPMFNADGFILGGI